MMSAVFLVQFYLIGVSISEVFGHGRLVEPPGRATAWRYGFNTPTDYNDNQLYCGGFYVSNNKNYYDILCIFL